MLEVGPDLLRLLSLPVLAWAAWSDYQVRRVDSRIWPILIAVGGIAAIWQIIHIVPINSPRDAYIHHRLIAVPVVVALISAFLLNGNAIGGADAKALFALGLLFPTVHQYTLPVLGLRLPLFQATTGALVVTIVMNGFVFGAYYALRMWVQNFRRGERSQELFLSKPVGVSELADTVGQLIIDHGTDDESVVDADALRMYLRWRDETVDSLGTRGRDLRHPESITKTYEVETGAIQPNPDRLKFLPLPKGTTVPKRAVLSSDSGSADDPWGAERFLEEIDHDAYGITADGLRAALDYLCSHDKVRVQPAYPLIVPLFLGLLTALTVGDMVVLWMYLTVPP